MRKTSKDEAARAVILDAARTVFRKWGLTKTTMEDVAREARKGKSSLYYYFKSKEEIFDTLVTIEVGALLQRAKEKVEHEVNAKDKLRNYLVASLAEMKSAASIYAAVLQEVQRDPRFVRKIRSQFEEQEVQFISAILSLGVQQKQYTFENEREKETAAQVILEIIRALELYLFLENYNSEHVDMAAKLIANGI
jgi:AcrR family transcriptional regulator